jgi:hypothetical protein
MNKESRTVAEMTGHEARELITSAVANGMMRAGLVLMLLGFAIGFGLSALVRYS